MRTPSLDGLVYIDLLEAYGSSRLAAELCFLSQSNVYRAAIALSAELGLHLEKREGSYRAMANADVLASLRVASRLLRARGNAPLRFIGDYRSPLQRSPVPEGLWNLPQTWLGQRRSLQLLDAGVIDLLLQRSTELLPILGLAPDSLAVGRWTFTPSYALLPLNTESVQIYAQRDHPLHGVAAVTPAQLRTFPSPAFADSIFPGLKDCLRPHGLWGTRLRSTAMRHCFWEFFALELGMIVASTPNAVSVATQHDPGVLRPVSYSTGLVDHDLLVVPIDLLDEPSVDSVISSITATYNLKLPKGRRLGGVSHRLLRAPHTAVSW